MVPHQSLTVHGVDEERRAAAGGDAGRQVDYGRRSFVDAVRRQLQHKTTQCIIVLEGTMAGTCTCRLGAMDKQVAETRTAKNTVIQSKHLVITLSHANHALLLLCSRTNLCSE